MKSQEDFKTQFSEKLSTRQFSGGMKFDIQKQIQQQQNKEQQPLSQSDIATFKKIFSCFRDFKIDKQNKIQLTEAVPKFIYQTIDLWKRRPNKCQSYTITLVLNEPKIQVKKIIELIEPFASITLIIDGVKIENKRAIHKTQNNIYYEGIDNQWMMITKTNGDVIDYYEGEVKEKMEHGQGVLYHMANNKIIWNYQGEFVEGKREGFGKETNSKGLNYEGHFKNDFKHGQGLEIVLKKRKHQKSGQSQFVQKNRYKGNFEYGYKQGKGIQITEHGQYEGQWHEGVKHGKGIIRYKKGGSYEGEWMNNCFHGEGTFIQMILVDGQEKFNKYVGEFKDGGYHGKGVMEYWNGDSYDGQWAFWKKEGTGYYKWADGDYYDGNWQKDSAQGMGAACFGGSFYEGEFHLGVKHGLGEENDEEGNTIKAIWQNGHIIKKLEVNGQIVEEDQQ